MGNRYEIRDKIGQGGVGEVYMAHDTQLDREVAIKRLKAGDDQDDDELFREARALSALQHPNVVTVFDVGSDEDGPFAVMELLKGETLDETVERSPMTLDDFRGMVRQTLEGVIAAHSVGLLHRDIKPSNLMVSWLPSGKFQLKILDFGLAKFSANASEQTSDQEDGILGSIYFMAPEQFERGALDARTDVYALGCVYYYSLTGLHPFDGETSPQVMASHLRHDVRDLAALRPDVPPEVCRWVMWLINRKADERPSSAKEAYDFFREGNAGEPVGIPDATNTAGVPTTTGQRPVLLTKTGAVAVTKTGPVLVSKTGPVLAHTSPVLLAGKTSGVRPISGATGPTGLTPTFEEPEKAGFPKWALITLPLLLAGAALFILQFMGGKNEERAERERFRNLAEAKAPKGDVQTVKWLTKFLPQTENDNSLMAAKILSKLKGAGVGAEMVDQLDNFEGEPLNNLVTAIGLSGYGGAGKDLVKLFKKTKSEKTRSAILVALAQCSSERDLPPLVRLLPDVEDPQDQAALQEAILRICRARPSEKLRTAPLLVELRKSVGNPALRRHVITMLGQLGEPSALPALIEELGATDKTVRSITIRALSDWKTSAPATDLFDLAKDASNDAERESALLGFIRLIGSSSDLPMAARAAQLKRAYTLAKETGLNRAAPAVFIELQGIADPAALEFAEEAAAEPDAAKEAERAVKVLKRTLDRVVALEGGKAALPASAGRISGDNAAYQSREGGGVIGGWDGTDTQVSWLVTFPEAGDYEIISEQSAPKGFGGSYQIAMGGSIYDAKTQRTTAETSFLDVSAATVAIGESGNYEITVRPVEIMGDGLMLLRSIKITKK